MNPIQILAVDDQIASLIALEDILLDVDAHIIKATSAKEALLIMLKQPVDCVLLDVSMPEMDGFEFLQTLRAAPAHTHIPVIMITGKVFSENETLKAYQYGAVDFLLKPLDPETVYRKVSFIVQQAQRIKSIERIETLLNNLEAACIQPLAALLGNQAIPPTQHAALSDLSDTLNTLNTAWKDVHHEH